MKNKIIYLLAGLAILSSCKKTFLDRPSLNTPTLDNYYTTAEQVQGATGLLYNQAWYNYMDKAFHCIGEVYGGNMLTSAGDPNYGNNAYVFFTVESTDGQDLLAWQSFYKVAGNATVLINTLLQKRGQVSDPSFIDQGIAEARFIRGVAYFFIARVFGDAPIVADPVALAGSGNYNVPRYLQKDVIKFALGDFAAAEAALPETSYQPGRVTKYSAAGMAAKAYLYEGNYDSAVLKANEVIQSGKYSLYPNYGEMFTSAKANNNPESLFALQWIAGGYSYANDVQAYAGPACLLKPDFGTGYSSLSYLHRFPFDKIKIDRSFIKSIVDEGASSAIVQAVVNIAAASNMTTTAEGVEQEWQRELLRELGCTEMQGFLFSAAVPATEIRRMLISHRDEAASAA